MQRKIQLVCAILILPVVAFWIGHASGTNSASRLQTARDLKLHQELVELDRSFFTNAITQPNAMTSGTYTLETEFTGNVKAISFLTLEFSTGKLVKTSEPTIQDIVQTGNFISWGQFNVDEVPSERFIGVIDGGTMWGRVYREPGQGWRQGEPPAYGVWKLYPQATNK